MDAEAWQRAGLFEQLADAPPHTLEERSCRRGVPTTPRCAPTCWPAAGRCAGGRRFYRDRCVAPALLEAAAAPNAAATARLAGTAPMPSCYNASRGGMGQVWLGRARRRCVPTARGDQAAAQPLGPRTRTSPASAPNGRSSPACSIPTSPTWSTAASALPVCRIGWRWNSSRAATWCSHCDARRLDLVQRLCLFLTVCAAVSRPPAPGGASRLEALQHPGRRRRRG